MPRNPTTLTKAALLAERTGHAFWYLVEFSHPTLPTPIRISSNNETISRLGVDWSPAFFRLALPGEDAERISNSTLTIDNVDRALLDALLSITAPALTVRIYVATSADDFLFGPFELAWRETSWDFKEVKGSLEPEDLLNELSSKDEFVPSKFPAGFR